MGSCSTKKNRWINRTYHNTTSHYNGFFNAREKLKESVKGMEGNHQENFEEILPIFIYGDEATAQSMFGDMDIVYEKCSRVINRHSMNIKGKEKCKWIDDSWMLIGKSHFYKQDYTAAQEIFKYVYRNYPKSHAKYEAMLWSVRTAIEAGDEREASRVLGRLEGDKDFPKDLKEELNAVSADFYLKQGNYEDAIIFLKRCVELTRKKRVKTRRMFILAQIYQADGDYQQSSGLYAQVIKRNPTYQMAFYARINRALAFDSSTGNSDEVRKALMKMLRDDKNIEFQDQIYYALAELELAEQNEPEGIDFLTKATQASVSNNTIKGKAFLKLAEIYFVKPKYEKAQVNYDSAVSFLPKEYPNYERIVGISESLTQLITDINIIETEDSLQGLRDLSEAELDQLIEDKIEEAIEAEEQRRLDQEQNEFNRLQNQLQSAQSFQGGNGKFWPYDPAQIGFGASEFKRIWGTRKLEDNWRRSNRRSLPNTAFQEDPESGVGTAVAGGGNGGRLTNRDKSFYLKDIPFTDEALEASTNRMIDAYYDLGMVYKDQMFDDPKAITAFEDLVTRFPDNRFEVTAFYQLYLLYRKDDTRDAGRAEYYKGQILSKYSDSEYAQLIRDPAYFEKKKAKKGEAVAYYKKTYGYYKRGYYSQSLENCNKANQLYPNNDLRPKFDLLKALCTGKISGKEQLVAELNGVIQSHGSHEVADEARKILAYLKEQSEKEKAEKEKAEQVANLYAYEPETKHSFILLVPAEGNKINQVKIQISDYNRRAFRLDGLKVEAVFLDNGKTHMVTVKQFDSAAEALTYYKAFSNESLRLKGLNDKGYAFFTISYTNTAKFYQDKREDIYLEFFNENYLKEE